MKTVDLNEFILLKRRERKLSQAQLAEKCNVSRNLISMIECGKANVTFSVLTSIIETLGYKIIFTPETAVEEYEKLNAESEGLK